MQTLTFWNLVLFTLQIIVIVSIYIVNDLNLAIFETEGTPMTISTEFLEVEWGLIFLF